MVNLLISASSLRPYAFPQTKMVQIYWIFCHRLRKETIDKLREKKAETTWSKAILWRVEAGMAQYHAGVDIPAIDAKTIGGVLGTG